MVLAAVVLFPQMHTRTQWPGNTISKNYYAQHEGNNLRKIILLKLAYTQPYG